MVMASLSGAGILLFSDYVYISGGISVVLKKSNENPFWILVREAVFIPVGFCYNEICLMSSALKDILLQV